MNKKNIRKSLILSMICCFVLAIPLQAQQDDSADKNQQLENVNQESAENLKNMRFVQVRTASVRSGSKTWSPLVATVKYGDGLKVISPTEPWVEVRTSSGSQGFVHVSALSKKVIVVDQIKPDFAGDVAGVDVVLAGKGFSAEIEQVFANNKTELNYAAVDLMEGRVIGEGDLVLFRKEGGLE